MNCLFLEWSSTLIFSLFSCEGIILFIINTKPRIAKIMNEYLYIICQFRYENLRIMIGE